MRKSLLLTAVLAGSLGYGLALPSYEVLGSGDRGRMRHAKPAVVEVDEAHAMQGEMTMDGSMSGQMEMDASAAGGNRGALPTVTIASSVMHKLAVRTAKVAYGDLPHSIETIGKITRVDPMARRTLTPPIRGELVRIADKSEGDLVKAGEFLFSVRSEDLFDHELAFQAAYQAGDRAAASAMIPALRGMGLSPDQIARLQAGEAPKMVIEVRAFEDGFIYTRRGRVGDKVHTGFTVFNVGGNYRLIEVTAEIFERQWGWVKQDQQAFLTVRGLPGSVFEGKVVRVEPPVGYTTRSLEVALRFRTDNPELSQSMFAHVSIVGQALKHVLLVPSDSVIRTGEGDRVVVMRGDNRFQPVSVVAGEASGGLTEIRSGLQDGDKVVASGQFLIDSESNLQAGFRRHGMHTHHHHQAAPTPAEASPLNPDQAHMGLGPSHHADYTRPRA